MDAASNPWIVNSALVVLPGLGISREILCPITTIEALQDMGLLEELDEGTHRYFNWVSGTDAQEAAQTLIASLPLEIGERLLRGPLRAIAADREETAPAQPLNRRRMEDEIALRLA